MVDPVTAFVVSTAVTAGGTIYSAQQQRKSAKAQQRAAALQERRQKVEQARRRKEAIREARAALGTAVNRAALQGVSGSSGALGGQGSIVSQANTNLSFLDETQRITDQASRQLGKARVFAQRAETGAAVAGLGQIGMNLSNSGGTALLNRIFGEPQVTST